VHEIGVIADRQPRFCEFPNPNPSHRDLVAYCRQLQGLSPPPRYLAKLRPD
jgi:hypothetical protein